MKSRIVIALSIFLFIGAIGHPPGVISREQKPRDKNADVDRAVRDANRAAFDLYRELARRDGNLVFSPFGVSTAMAMLYAGAKGNTAAEIEKAMHFSLGQEGLHPAYKKILKSLKRRGSRGGNFLVVGSRLWGQEGYDILPEFIDLTSTYYRAPMKQVDFNGAPEKACDEINAWATKQTRGKINSVIKKENVKDQTGLVITNAVYFKGKWEKKFKKEDTLDMAFWINPQEEILVPTMHQKEEYMAGANLEVAILEMQYKRREHSMLIILPQQVDGLSELEGKLSTESLDEWIDLFSLGEIDLYLPKFSFSSELDLKKVLLNLGVNQAFDRRAADFSGITDSDPGLFLGESAQKAWIEANEKGVEAVSITFFGIFALSGAPAFQINRPFLFLIRDNRTGLILFMGRVVDPRGGS